MSLIHTPTVPDHFLPKPLQRKRTASFSVASTSLAASPRPTKAARTSSAMPLRRTESYLTLPTVASTSVVVISTQGSCRPSGSFSTVPYQQSLQYYKEQRQRHKAATRASLNLEPITIRTRLERTYSQPQPQSSRALPFRASATPPPSRSRPLTRTTALLDVTSFANTAESTSSCNPTPFRIPSTCRASSPLSPKQQLRPGRPVFPRSKPEPDLYRLAIKTCMRYSPEGQKILQMGPRLALNILTATQDLERMVAEEESREARMMEDRVGTVEVAPRSNAASDDHSILSSSWVDMQVEDWEMLDDEDED